MAKKNSAAVADAINTEETVAVAKSKENDL